MHNLQDQDQHNRLRRQAEAAIQGRPVDLNGLTVMDVQQILHELQVHQIELTIQNENLLQTQYELEIARTKYSELYENAPIGYFTLDGKGFVVEVNKTGLELFQTEKELVLNRPFASFVREDFLGIFYAHRHQIQLTQKPQTCEVRVMRTDKQVLDVQIESRPLVTVDNLDDCRIAMAIVDVTMQKQVEKQLRQQEKMAAIGQLAGGVAHDFNNILLGITATSEFLMRQADLTEFAHKRIKRIYQQSERAARLVAQLLDFSRESVSEQAGINLYTFLEDMVPILRRTVKQHIQIVLESEYSAKKLWVRADKVQLQQIVLNLVLNASYAMEKGGIVQIILSSETVNQDSPRPVDGMATGHWMCVQIKDSGSGIPASVLPKIFDPFFTTKPLGEGTGLGLSQVYGIVRKHRGHVNVESTVGIGTTMSVYFPVHKTQTGPLQLPGKNEIYQGNGQTVMIVEDDRVVLDATKEILESLGYHVIAAASGETGLARFSEHSREIELVLIDMVMPQMGGTELFEAMRRLRPSIKGLMISGYSLDLHKEMLDAMGLSGYITKPFSTSTLSKLIYDTLKAPA